MKEDINFSNFVFAPPDEVLELITNPEFIKEWSGQAAVVEKKPGGKFEMFDGWVKGEVISIGEAEFSFTWKPAEWSDETPASLVTLRFEARGRGTEVYLNHADFPSAEAMESHKEGWKKFFFDPIGEYLANRKFG